jgi:hypothetical protein
MRERESAAEAEAEYCTEDAIMSDVLGSFYTYKMKNFEYTYVSAAHPQILHAFEKRKNPTDPCQRHNALLQGRARFYPASGNGPGLQPERLLRACQERRSFHRQCPPNRKLDV